MLKVQHSPNQAIRRGQIKHPTDTVIQELHKPDESLCNSEFKPRPPPRHPGRLLRSTVAVDYALPAEITTNLPTRRASFKQPHAYVQTVECLSSDDDYFTMEQPENYYVRPASREQRPSSRRQHYPTRPQNDDGFPENPRWSAFPSPPEGPPSQPPPNRPLPQLPSAALPSRPRKKPSNTSHLKHSPAPPKHASQPAYGPNVFPPSPPQEFSSQPTSPVSVGYASSQKHTRHHSDRSQSSHSSGGSVLSYPSYDEGHGSQSLRRPPALPPTPPQKHEKRYMTTVLEEADGGIQRLTSISRRSIGSKHSSAGNDPIVITTSHSIQRHKSVSSHSSDSQSRDPSKASNSKSGKGFLGLFKSKTPHFIGLIQANDIRGVAEMMMPGRAGPELTNSYKDQRTPLHYAAELGHLEIAEILLHNNARTEARTKDQDRTPLYLAAREGHLEMVKLLLSHNAAPNAASKYDGATAMHKAAHRGHTHVIAALVDAKADIDKRDIEGLPPIMWAVQDGNKQLHAVHKLVAAGIDLEARIKRGKNTENSSAEGVTTLYRVVDIGDVIIAKVLLENGANANADAPHGVLALHLACKRGQLGMAMVLIEFGANIDVRSVEGRTPLHFAAQFGHRKVCLELVRQGADRNARTKAGETPEQLGKKNGFLNLFD